MAPRTAHLAAQWTPDQTLDQKPTGRWRSSPPSDATPSNLAPQSSARISLNGEADESALRTTQSLASIKNISLRIWAHIRTSFGVTLSQLFYQGSLPLPSNSQKIDLLTQTPPSSISASSEAPSPPTPPSKERKPPKSRYSDTSMPLPPPPPPP